MTRLRKFQIALGCGWFACAVLFAYLLALRSQLGSAYVEHAIIDAALSIGSLHRAFTRWLPDENVVVTK